MLVIVDIQEKLAAVMKERQKMIDNCLHLIEISKLLNIPIVLNEQYPMHRDCALPVAGTEEFKAISGKIK
ncbi:MAG: hypothetical protein HY755_03885 [Nitrospirae bacterium]|nr:hypothetical protein [Nitrospirota bacterium]